MTDKKALVTGGSGFIGSALVRVLLKSGYQVRVLDNHSRGGKSKLGDLENQIEMQVGDIRDPELVRKACKDQDLVCHLAYINGTEFFYSKPEMILDVGVRGMINVLDGCIGEKVTEFLLMSSSEVYQTPEKVPTDESAGLSVPDPLNPRYSYGGGKIISELMAIHYGKKNFKRTLIIRPHNVVGPDMGWEHVIPQFCKRMNELDSKSSPVDFPIQGDGAQTRAFVHINDFAEGMRVILEKGEDQNIYHLGTDMEKRISDLAHEVARSFDLKINLIPGKPAIGATLRRCPDIGKVRKLGFRPSMSFEETVANTAKWYRSQLNN